MSLAYRPLKMNRKRAGWYVMQLESDLALHVYKRGHSDWVFGTSDNPYSFHPARQGINFTVTQREARIAAGEYAMKLRGIAA